MRNDTPAPITNARTTLMVGRTREGDAVWRTDGGRAFTMSDGETITYRRWPFRWPSFWGYRRLPKPHLTYHQVAAALPRSERVLKALYRGPVWVRKGFLYANNGRMLAARATASVVLHWMEGCGMVLTRGEETKRGIRVDIDVEATMKNKIT